MGVTARNLLARRGRFVLDVPAFAGGAGGTAVLGPNGTGKTTLLLALQGLIAAEGQVESAQPSAAVFAQPAVLRGSALWNITVVAQSALQHDSSDVHERALRALDDVGLSEAAGVDARRLSTGQRQRLALARALACAPHILFLDEPFANIDADARPALRALIASYCARTPCELIVATSSLADVAALCIDAIVLDRGTVTHRGPVRDLPTADEPYVRALIAESRDGVAAPP